MEECEFCGEEFEGEGKLKIHWIEEHEEELNSHQKENAKKARKKKKEREEVRRQQRKKHLYQGLGGAVALVLVAVVGAQLIPSGGNGVGLDLKGEPMMGNASANVTVVEFGDYQCPYCQQFDQQVFPKLKENYIDTGKVKFYFVNYAFLGPDSIEAAVASECVYNQANSTEFWNFHHAVFENQGRENSGWVTPDLMVRLANQSVQGLDEQQLRTCISSSSTLSEVRNDRRMGSANGVTGTPTVYVNGEKLESFSYQAVSRAIEKELGN